MTNFNFHEVIQDRLDQLNLSAVAAERKFDIGDSTLRNLFRDRRERVNGRPVGEAYLPFPKLDTAKHICDALGLEFYIGPPRDLPASSACEPTLPKGDALFTRFTSDRTFPRRGYAKCSMKGWAKIQPLKDPLPAPDAITDEEAFYVDAIGDSMIPEGIPKGAKVLVSPIEEISEGDRVYLIDSESQAAIKRYLGESEGVGEFRGWLPISHGQQRDFIEERPIKYLKQMSKVVAVYHGMPGDKSVTYIPDPSTHKIDVDRAPSETVISNDIQNDYSVIEMHPAQQQISDGTIPRDPTSLNALAFPNYWLRHHNIAPSKASVMQMDGDDMEPNFGEGTLVLINHKKTKIKKKHVYVFEYKNQFMCKRLEESDFGILMHSDNQYYGTLLAPIADVNAGEFRIIGEVVWSCRIEGVR